MNCLGPIMIASITSMTAVLTRSKINASAYVSEIYNYSKYPTLRHFEAEEIFLNFLIKEAINSLGII